MRSSARLPVADMPRGRQRAPRSQTSASRRQHRRSAARARPHQSADRYRRARLAVCTYRWVSPQRASTCSLTGSLPLRLPRDGPRMRLPRLARHPRMRHRWATSLLRRRRTTHRRPRGRGRRATALRQVGRAWRWRSRRRSAAKRDGSFWRILDRRERAASYVISTQN